MDSVCFPYTNKQGHFLVYPLFSSSRSYVTIELQDFANITTYEKVSL